ncbi:MAG: PQQ-dependent sugar dehydrogenase, partial [Vicinamibacterales bacterium]
PQAPHVMVVVTPGRGVAMQYRPEYGAASVQVGVISGVAPEWVRLRRSDNRYTGYASEDGITWRTIGTITVESLSFVPVLAVTSHNNSVTTTAVFEEATVRPFWSR